MIFPFGPLEIQPKASVFKGLSPNQEEHVITSKIGIAQRKQIVTGSADNLTIFDIFISSYQTLESEPFFRQN